MSSRAPGASDTADTAVTIPSRIASGTHYIGVMADCNDWVKERNETNKALAGDQITVAGP